MRALGCNQLQGFLFGRPVDADSHEARDWRVRESYQRRA
jgi:EAL domain-containing protein (putative c-di-GMP-specific phosphodiesterase class I)